MYLIHAALRAPRPGVPLPADTVELLFSVTRPDERVEHITVHDHADAGAVVGVYLLADQLTEAEAVVAELCRRAVATVPALRDWTVPQVGAPLVAPFYERLLTASGAPGRNRTGPFPST
ncbi:hypothetical protein [Kitasatospora sp. LaBMicrA B282]|uniref:hypothetical protein n=1 Tax=Kitasatospora sp. LaBMicrA B282 TaxID=3420949 RepID=UPI003D0E5CCF